MKRAAAIGILLSLFATLAIVRCAEKPKRKVESRATANPASVPDMDVAEEPIPRGNPIRTGIERGVSSSPTADGLSGGRT